MKKYSPEWTPSFGAIYFWVAMDKNKRIAVMINNNWGWIPKAVLTLPNIDSLMNELICYIWGESKIEKFISYPRYLNNYNGGFNLDMLSYWYHKKIDRIKIINNLKKELAEGKNNSDAYIAVNRGFFFYEALDGYNEGDDYPIGPEGVYKEKTKKGDYFRFLQPTIYGNIEDIPEELREVIAVSETLDFTKNRLLDNNLISSYFSRTYKN